jgi:hypothetical protein
MSARRALVLLYSLSACGSASDAPRSTPNGAPVRVAPNSAPSAAAGAPEAGSSTSRESTPSAESAPPNAAVSEDDPPAGDLASFEDPTTGAHISAVHDADRQVVYFDLERGALLAAPSGDAVSGWRISGDDLSWTRSSVAFRVRFGAERGERRAFFTETASGTICNLDVGAPDLLSISSTNEQPPNP